LAYEEQMLNRRYWLEVQKVGGQLASAESYRVTMEKALHEAEEKMHKAYSDAGRLVEEAEQKAKAAVAAEAARMKAEYDRRLEESLGKAKEEAVMAYRRDRGRAVEQATAFIDGGTYILGKIKEAFPEQDWSQLPVPELTDDLVEDEHKAILEEIDQEAAGTVRP
jgi:S-methylmethionine-dependent homocysteine/selenocysteine methylase